MQWKILFAAQAGWMLDGMDVMLYAFALTAIQKEFGLSSAVAGSLASLTLFASAFGGGFAGLLADKYGRARMLVYSILLYSVFTGMTATATSFGALALWRILVASAWARSGRQGRCWLQKPGLPSTDAKPWD